MLGDAFKDYSYSETSEVIVGDHHVTNLITVFQKTYCGRPLFCITRLNNSRNIILQDELLERNVKT